MAVLLQALESSRATEAKRRRIVRKATQRRRAFTFVVLGSEREELEDEDEDEDEDSQHIVALTHSDFTNYYLQLCSALIM